MKEYRSFFWILIYLLNLLQPFRNVARHMFLSVIAIMHWWLINESSFESSSLERVSRDAYWNGFCIHHLQNRKDFCIVWSKFSSRIVGFIVGRRASGLDSFNVVARYLSWAKQEVLNWLNEWRKVRGCNKRSEKFYTGLKTSCKHWKRLFVSLSLGIVIYLVHPSCCSV